MGETKLGEDRRPSERSGRKSPCTDDPAARQPPTAPYSLPGPQVEPAAAFWLEGNALPRVPTLDQVTSKFKDSNGQFRPQFFFPTDQQTISSEITELQLLAKNRDTILLNNAPAKLSHLAPLSEFLNLQNPPFGGIFDTTGQQLAVNFVNDQEQRILNQPTLMNTGGELARMFELETPGQYHHHVLNWLVFKRADVSPPRHARIWMALNMAIYSALSAAWWFKWAAPTGISFRLRPYEYDRNQSFAVLYDKVVPDDGNDNYDGLGGSLQGVARICPCPSPGTPRHPAYPSGHSTYSAAASRVLEYFFSPSTLVVEDDAEVIGNEPTGPDRFKKPAYIGSQLRKLANNIGEARIWGGVHWRSDHTFGRLVGRAVADVIIDQLRMDCVPVIAGQGACEENANNQPPTKKELDTMRAERSQPCPEPDMHDFIPPFEGDHLKRPRFLQVT